MLADKGNPAPDPRRFRPVSTTAVRFQLGDKGSSGEGVTFVLFCCPLLIGFPEVSRTTPGAWMQFTANSKKLLESIGMGRVTSFVENKQCLFRGTCLFCQRACLISFAPLVLQCGKGREGLHGFRMGRTKRLHAKGKRALIQPLCFLVVLLS